MAISQNIQEKANGIRNERKARNVRENIASVIEAIDEVAEDTKSRHGVVETEFVNIQNSESTRIAEEQTREANEISRGNAETTRRAAETDRINAENVRETNETNREKIISALKVCEPYNAEHTYFLYNKSIYQGSTFQCIAPNVGGIKGITPTDDGVNWLCIALKGQDGAGGDMFKAIYDNNNNGIVDDAEKLAGHDSSYYATAEEVSSHLADNTKHVTVAERTIWNNKVDSTNYQRSGGYAVTTGTSTAYTITLNPAPTAYTDGMQIIIKPHTDCGATPTLNVNGLGASTIVKQDGTAIASGDIKANKPLSLVRVGSNFFIRSAGYRVGDVVLFQNIKDYFETTLTDSFSKYKDFDFTINKIEQDGNYAYALSNANNKIYKINLTTFEVVLEIATTFSNPSICSVSIYGDYIYIADTLTIKKFNKNTGTLEAQSSISNANLETGAQVKVINSNTFYSYGYYNVQTFSLDGTPIWYARHNGAYKEVKTFDDKLFTSYYNSSEYTNTIYIYNTNGTLVSSYKLDTLYRHACGFKKLSDGVIVFGIGYDNFSVGSERLGFIASSGAGYNFNVHYISGSFVDFAEADGVLYGWNSIECSQIDRSFKIIKTFNIRGIGTPSLIKLLDSTGLPIVADNTLYSLFNAVKKGYIILK